MNRLLLSASAAAFATLAAIAPASAQARAQIGVLDCAVAGGIGLIIGSQKEMDCLFRPADNSGPQRYVGVIRKFGLDIGVTNATQIVWGVFAGGSTAPGALAGDYVGATAEVTLAAGLGANVLVGGSNRTIALQPLSVQAQTGLNIAAGVADLSLRTAR